MHEQWKYITSQLNIIPKPVYKGLLALFCIGAIVFLAVNRKETARSIVWLLFFEFMFLVLGITVFLRHTGIKAVVYPPLWSYASVWRYGDKMVLHEIIHNTLGCLMGFVLWRGCAKLVRGNKSDVNLIEIVGGWSLSDGLVV